MDRLRIGPEIVIGVDCGSAKSCDILGNLKPASEDRQEKQLLERDLATHENDRAGIATADEPRASGPFCRPLFETSDPNAMAQVSSQAWQSIWNCNRVRSRTTCGIGQRDFALGKSI